MTERLIYVGNLRAAAALQILLPASIQCFVRDDGTAILKTDDVRVAQQVARELDGRMVNGQAVSAIERSQLEMALNAARMVRCRRIVVTLATRLGLVKRDEQSWLQRLVALRGEAPVANAAELAIQQAKAQRTVPSAIFFSLLLGSLHPVVAQALRGGSLRKAESQPQQGTPRQICELVIDPVVLELNRRKAIQRQARRESKKVQKAGVMRGPDLAHAMEELKDADIVVQAFLERFDMAAKLGRTQHSRAVPAQDPTIENL